MTPDSPSSPREELEARITALLLGELTPEDAAALRQTIAQDAELAGLHERLKQAIELVRETIASPEQALLASADAPKLPADCREKLLKSFKVIRPKQLAWHRSVNWREWGALAAMVVGLLAVVATLMIPSKSKTFAGESLDGNLFAWFESGKSGSQKSTPLVGRDASTLSVGASKVLVAQVDAVASGTTAPLFGKVPALGRLQISGQERTAIAPPADTPGINSDRERKTAGTTVTVSGNTGDEHRPQAPTQPQTLGRNVALGENAPAQKDVKAEVDSKLDWGLKQSVDSTSRRSGRIALPEIAQLDAALLSREQAFDSTKNGAMEFFDTGSQNADLAGKQVLNEGRLLETARDPINLGVLDGHGTVAAQQSADFLSRQPGLSLLGGGGGGGRGGGGGIGGVTMGGPPPAAAPSSQSPLLNNPSDPMVASTKSFASRLDIDQDLAVRSKSLTEVYEANSERTRALDAQTGKEVADLSGNTPGASEYAGVSLAGMGGRYGRTGTKSKPADTPASPPVAAPAPPPAPAPGLPLPSAAPRANQQNQVMAGSVDLGDGSTHKINESGLGRQLSVDVNGDSSMFYRFRSESQARAAAPGFDDFVDFDVDARIEPQAQVSAGAQHKSELSRPLAEGAGVSHFGAAMVTNSFLSGTEPSRGNLGALLAFQTQPPALSQPPAFSFNAWAAPSPKPAESGAGTVYSVNAVGHRNAEGFGNTAAPSDDSKSIRRPNLAIVLPQVATEQRFLQREPQIQTGPVVIHDVMFGDKPVREMVKLSDEAKAHKERFGEENRSDKRGGVEALKTEVEKQNLAVLKKQAEVDKLKDALSVSDVEAAGLGSFNVLEPENLRKFETLRVEAQADHEALKTELDQNSDGRSDGDTSKLKSQIAASGARLSSLQAAVDKAKGVDTKTTIARRDYFQAKRELEENQDAREKLNRRILSGQIEGNIPKTVVEVIDQAEAKPRSKPSFWERLRGTVTGEVERDVRISIDRDLPDVAGILSEARPAQVYDPYFIQTEFEKIQSKEVLERVVTNLNLNSAWAGKRVEGKALGTEETVKRLKSMIDVRADPTSRLIDVRVKSAQPEEAARIANEIAKVYREQRLEQSKYLKGAGIEVLNKEYEKQNKEVVRLQQELDRRENELRSERVDVPVRKLAAGAPVPQPDILTSDNSFSTFSLNVSDVSFKLAAASLEKGQMPDPATVRSEEFINAFDYRDCEPQGSAPIAFAWERARYPFAHDRDLLRFSIKTAAIGRQPGRPLNLVLLLDNSGSMERADRVRIIQECLRVLAGQLQPQDRVSVVAFARTPRLWIDGLPGSQAGELAQRVGGLTPQGGTNLEDAMNLAYQTARRHFLPQGVNRVVLLTDGAANLGDVEPESLKKKVEANRKQGIALDCFGIGWEGFNDELLEILSRNGDGRYGFVNSPEAATTEFAGQLAGALKVAASDVKVQVEFNPRRTTVYRQIGYAKHQLKKEQFRDNTVDAAEIGAAEAGNALYVVQVNPAGEGPIGTVRVRFKVPGTTDYREHEWPVPYDGPARSLEQSSAALRLAATASAFSEWLVSSPYAAEVTPDKLLASLSGVPETWAADPRPKKLEWMIRQARSLARK